MLTIIYMTIIKDNFSLVILANDHRVILFVLTFTIVHHHPYCHVQTKNHDSIVCTCFRHCCCNIRYNIQIYYSRS